MSTNTVSNGAFDAVPEEVLLCTFSFLKAESLSVVNLVSKHWSSLTKKDSLLYQLNAKALGYKRVSFIDEAAWKDQAKVDLAKNGLSFEGYCVNQCKLIKELQTCLAWPIEKINGIKSGVTVITIPKGLSVNKLQVLAPAQVFGWVHPGFTKKYGDIEVSDAYTIIITDSVMDGTRAKDAKQQVIEIQKHGGVRPKAIEEIALLVLTFLISGKRLYDKGKVVLNGEEKELLTYTRCEEQVSDYQIIAGGFDSDGFIVNFSYYDYDHYGLGALRTC